MISYSKNSNLLYLSHILVVCITNQTWYFLLKEELDRLLKAAQNGEVEDLHYLIEKKRYSVDTRGPNGDPVSQCFS